AKSESYNPFDYREPEAEKSLYLEFASLNEDDEILSFANRYGLPYQMEPNPPELFPLTVFREDVEEMRALINLWGALARNNEAEIIQYALQAWRLDDPMGIKSAFYNRDPKSLSAAEKNFLTGLKKAGSLKPPVTDARSGRDYFVKRLNDHLEGNIYPRL